MKSLIQFKRRVHLSLAVSIISIFALSPHAAQAETFGTATGTLLRGTFPGNFPGEYYGGDIAGAWPVVLNSTDASSYVLGAPDGKFLSLPGGPGVTGEAFPGAYVEVSFGANFDVNTLLKIWEVGDNAESAQLFLWTNNGGNIQPTVQTNPFGVITLDLSNYASTLAFLGATSFTKVGIGGLDLLGPSQGFDLDAMSITAVPEPSTYLLMLAGLGLLGFMNRRREVTID